MIEPVWIVGFTGHRPKSSPGRTSMELERLRPAVRGVLRELMDRAKARDGRAELLCGLAAGADILAAQVAEELGMAVHVILPLPETLFFEDFRPAPGSEPAGRWAEDLAEAQRFIAIAKKGTGGATFRISEGSQLRDECFYDQGMQIVDASDAVVALWDGEDIASPGLSEADGKQEPNRGGTADVVALARADMMPYLRTTKTKDGYVWRPTPCLIINLMSGEVSGSAEDFASEQDAGYAEMHKLAKAARLEFGELHLKGTPGALLKFVDKGAKDWAAQLRRSLLAGSGLHFAGSLVAAVAAAAQVFFVKWQPTQLAAIELVLVGGAVALMAWSHFKHSQARWLELRLATELLRGLLEAGRLMDPLFPLATQHLPGWRRYCISMGLEIWRATSDQSLDEAKARYREERLDRQLNHFRKYDPHQRHWWYRFANFAGPVIAVLAVIVVLLALIHKYHDAHELLAGHEVSATIWSALAYRFLPIALPLLAGAISSLQSVADTKRRAQVYPELVERLSSSINMLPSLRTPAALRRFVRRTEEVLIDELVGWYAAAKGISH